MKTTRKTFLATAAAGLAATTLRPAALFGAEAALRDGRAFQDLVGETFQLRGFGRRDAVDVVLDEYTERPARSSTKQFTLTFVAPGGESLREGTYAADHPRLGTFDVFIIPAGRDAKGRALYRADFNLLLTVASAPAPVTRRR